MHEYEVTFDYANYTLTAYYIVDGYRPIVTELWLGDNPITELVREHVFSVAHEAAIQDIINLNEYNRDIIDEMRYENE